MLRSFVRASLTSAACALVALTGTADEASGRSAQILHHYTLPPFSLENIGVSPEELATAVANGLPSPDLPALGSGLQRLGGNYYLGVTDRGPTFTRTAPSPGRVFVLPNYTPTIVFFRAISGEIVPDAYLPIVVDDAGTPATGVSNSASDDSVPFDSPSATVPMPFNANGLDVEDVYMFRDGHFAVVEEYSPSLAIVSSEGKVLVRYTPAGKTLAGASYPVSDRLPAILSQRRGNRGFESIAVSKDERTAFLMTQSPLGPTGSGTPTRNSRVIRLLRLDITNPLDAQVTGQFVLLMSPASEYRAGNRQQDLKISAAVSLNETELLLLERSDEAGIGGVKLILINLEGATDVSGMAVAQTLALENSNLDLNAVGITPASSRVVFRNEETPEMTDFKLEGLAVLNRNDVALSNDNDFGMEGPTSFRIWIVRLADQLP